ncbi:MAG: outer membrane beta-barrel protein [Ignavibacteria bacterium]|nr:outer membrane beta-barrel protein [Ignavibacteria bacterium]
MKRAKILVSLLLITLISGVSYSQLSFKIGPMIGLTSPTVDYSGDVKDFYAGTKYGLRSGMNFGALSKVVLGPLNGRLSVSYASIDNSGVASTDQPNSTLTVNNSIFMFTLGTEFGFGIPFSPVKPYAGIDLLISSISGSFKFNQTNGSGITNDEKSIKSASRTGLGFAMGAEITFGKTFTMDLSLRYNLINLFGKSYEGVTNSNNRVDAYTSLNDAADPNYSATNSNHPVGNDRSIATIQIQLGILFGF